MGNLLKEFVSMEGKTRTRIDSYIEIQTTGSCGELDHLGPEGTLRIKKKTLW